MAREPAPLMDRAEKSMRAAGLPDWCERLDALRNLHAQIRESSDIEDHQNALIAFKAALEDRLTVTVRTAAELEATAYHEAGHFVALYLLCGGTYLGILTIEPNAEEGTAGHVTHEGWEAWCDHDGSLAPSLVLAGRREVVMAFAGIEAQRLVQPEAQQWHAAMDDEQALEILRILGEEAKEGDYRAEARRFVVEHRGAIEGLARELLRLRTIHDPFEAEIIVDIARGDATPEDLERYRMMRDPAVGEQSRREAGE